MIGTIYGSARSIFVRLRPRLPRKPTSPANSYIINPVLTSNTINVVGYAPGVYTVILVCNGQVADAKALSIN